MATDRTDGQELTPHPPSPTGGQSHVGDRMVGSPLPRLPGPLWRIGYAERVGSATLFEAHTTCNPPSLGFPSCQPWPWAEHRSLRRWAGTRLAVAAVWPSAAPGPGRGGCQSDTLVGAARRGRQGGWWAAALPQASGIRRKKGPSGASPFTRSGLSFPEQIKRKAAQEEIQVWGSAPRGGSGHPTGTDYPGGRVTSPGIAALTEMVPAQCSGDPGASRGTRGPSPQSPKPPAP